MIKKLTLMSVVGMVCALQPVTAQKNEHLFIYGRLPDIPLGKMLNYEDPTATFHTILGDEGKLIIFSFWNSGCGVCINQFAQENNLQIKYRDSIQLILVTSEQSETARKTIERWEKKHGTRLVIPVIVEDTLISQYIRQWNLPSYAWFAGDGRMIAQTSTHYLNDATVSLILHATSGLKPRPIKKAPSQNSFSPQ